MVTRQALEELEDSANSGALQPAVCILTGDMNLDRCDADTVVQPLIALVQDVLNHWHTKTSTAALPGDVAFIKGTPSEAFEIGIGRSYPNGGIRRGIPDCFGIGLCISLVHIPSQPAGPSRTIEPSGAVVMEGGPDRVQARSWHSD